MVHRLARRCSGDRNAGANARRSCEFGVRRRAGPGERAATGRATQPGWRGDVAVDDAEWCRVSPGPPPGSRHCRSDGCPSWLEGSAAEQLHGDAAGRARCRPEHRHDAMADLAAALAARNCPSPPLVRIRQHHLPREPTIQASVHCQKMTALALGPAPSPRGRGRAFPALRRGRSGMERPARGAALRWPTGDQQAPQVRRYRRRLLGSGMTFVSFAVQQSRGQPAADRARRGTRRGCDWHSTISNSLFRRNLWVAILSRHGRE